MSILSKRIIGPLTLLAGASLMAISAGTAVALVEKYSVDMSLTPGSLKPGSADWQAAFSVDQFATRDAAPPKVDLSNATKLTVTYKGKALGMDVGRLFITAAFTDDAYEMTYKVETAKALQWLEQSEQFVESRGLMNHDELTSLYYFKDERESDSQQLVELTRTQPNERFRYWSAPEITLVHPVMPSIGLDTVDPLAALALLGFSEEVEGKEPCDRFVPVYDGRRRFNMIMTPAGTKKLKKRGKNRYVGFTYRCKVEMIKTAGYNQKNMKKDFDGDGYVYLAPLPEEVRTKNFSYFPVFVEGKSGMLTATVDAKAPIITFPDGRVLNMGASKKKK